MIGSQTNRTTAYHPQSNGSVERWHRTLESAIKCHETDDWVRVLPTIMLGLRNSLKEDIGTSAAELTYGTTLRLPGEYFFTNNETINPKKILEHLRQTIRQVRPRAFKHQNIHDCTHVFIRVDKVKRPLDQPYEGPFPILQRTSSTHFKVDVKGKSTEISIDRLKPALVANEESQPGESPRPIPRTYGKLKSSENVRVSENTQSYLICKKLNYINKKVTFADSTSASAQ